MASGWNLWVWLECIGVVSGCCCKEVYRYPHNNYYFSLLSTCLLFFGSSIPVFLVHFYMFFRSLNKPLRILSSFASTQYCGFSLVCQTCIACAKKRGGGKIHLVYLDRFLCVVGI